MRETQRPSSQLRDLRALNMPQFRLLSSSDLVRGTGPYCRKHVVLAGLG
jgi:hypothetical protein